MGGWAEAPAATQRHQDEEGRGREAHTLATEQGVLAGTELTLLFLPLLCLTVGVCSPQLWGSEEAKQKVGSVRFTDSAAEKKFQQMEKEIKEQERLLKGYQQVSSRHTHTRVCVFMLQDCVGCHDDVGVHPGPGWFNML